MEKSSTCSSVIDHRVVFHSQIHSSHVQLLVEMTMCEYSRILLLKGLRHRRMMTCVSRIRVSEYIVNKNFVKLNYLIQQLKHQELSV